ncbi:MAG: hypothetical protein HY791_39130 [Deltaproteobacteria bacterium]|nr:hypothetical protein [Deltaproteobacteria bacterium]
MRALLVLSLLMSSSTSYAEPTGGPVDEPEQDDEDALGDEFDDESSDESAGDDGEEGPESPGEEDTRDSDEELEEETLAVDAEQAADAAARSVAVELAHSAYRFCTDPTYVPSDQDAARLGFTAREATHGACTELRVLSRTVVQERPWMLPAWSRTALVAACFFVPGLLLVRGLRARGLGTESRAPSNRAKALSLRARAELGRGELSSALSSIEKSFVAHLESSGTEIGESATNREIARALEGTPYSPFAERWARSIELGRFGGAVQTDLEALLSELETIVATRAPIRFAIALTLLGACSPSPHVFSPPKSLSHEPSGGAALVGLLQAAAINARSVASAPAELPEAASVLVLRTSALSNVRLDSALDQGLAVVLLDDAGTADSLLPVTRTRSATVASLESAIGGFCGLDPERVGELAKGAIRSSMPGLAPRAGSRTSPVSKHPLELTPILWIGADRTDLAAIGAHRIGEAREELPGCLFLFSDDTLFVNASLARVENARFAVAFFASLLTEGDEVLFVEPRPPRGIAWLAAIASSPVGPLFAHLALLALAMLWAAGARFGRAHAPAARPTSELVRHVRAMADLR